MMNDKLKWIGGAALLLGGWGVGFVLAVLALPLVLPFRPSCLRRISRPLAHPSRARPLHTSSGRTRQIPPER